MPKDVSFIQEYKLPLFGGGAQGFFSVLNCLPVFISFFTAAWSRVCGFKQSLHEARGGAK